MSDNEYDDEGFDAEYSDEFDEPDDDESASGSQEDSDEKESLRDDESNDSLSAGEESASQSKTQDAVDIEATFKDAGGAYRQHEYDNASTRDGTPENVFCKVRAESPVNVAGADQEKDWDEFATEFVRPNGALFDKDFDKEKEWEIVDDVHAPPPVEQIKPKARSGADGLNRYCDSWQKQRDKAKQSPRPKDSSSHSGLVVGLRHQDQAGSSQHDKTRPSSSVTPSHVMTTSSSPTKSVIEIEKETRVAKAQSSPVTHKPTHGWLQKEEEEVSVSVAHNPNVITGLLHHQSEVPSRKDPTSDVSKDTTSEIQHVKHLDIQLESYLHGKIQQVRSNIDPLLAQDDDALKESKAKADREAEAAKEAEKARVEASATKIQARIRGYQTRKAVGPPVAEVKKTPSGKVRPHSAGQRGSEAGPRGSIIESTTSSSRRPSTARARSGPSRHICQPIPRYSQWSEVPWAFGGQHLPYGLVFANRREEKYRRVSMERKRLLSMKLQQRECW